MKIFVKLAILIISSFCFLWSSNANAQGICGDAVCDASETYCTCPADCACDLLQLLHLDGYNYPATPNTTGDVVWCPEFLAYNGAAVNFTSLYMPITASGIPDCSGSSINSASISSTGAGVVDSYGNPTNTIGVNAFNILFLEVSPADIASGSVTVTLSIADNGNGNPCSVDIILDFSQIPSVQDPFCPVNSYYFGCTDYIACNFDPGAYFDDGTCLYPYTPCDDGDPYTLYDFVDYNCDCAGIAVTAGCTDANACNFDIYAAVDDGSCLYPGDNCDDGDPNTINDMVDALCDCVGMQPAIDGCTDPCALNYDPNATTDDGSCTLPVGGNVSTPDTLSYCINDAEQDFINMTVMNEVGVFYTYILTNLAATVIEAGPFDNGEIDLNGLLGGIYLVWGVSSADELIVPASGLVADIPGCDYALSNSIQVSLAFCQIFGCTDPTACNYDMFANQNDYNCIYFVDCEGVCGGNVMPGDPCDDGNPYTNNDVYDANCDCEGFIMGGCTDPIACNYDPDANNDDGSCLYLDCFGDCGGFALPGELCDDGNPQTINDVIDAYCNCAGTPTFCLSEPGNILFTQAGFFGNNSYICYGDNVIVDADDFILLPGQSVYYIFHNLTPGLTYNDLPIPTVNILETGSFVNNGLVLAGQTVYVTAFGATSAGGGLPDFNDPCITISNTLVLNMLNPVQIISEENCDGDTGEFLYEFYVGGGLPELIPGLTYDVTGTFYNGPVDPLDPILVGPILDGLSYEIYAEDDNLCQASLIRTIECIKVAIELKEFKGAVKDNGNLIEWTTASELDNDHFTLESSVDGIEFNVIATIQSKRNTTSTGDSYQFLDQDPGNGITYYRLYDTDIQGQSSLNPGIVELNRKNDLDHGSFEIMDVYPNPASDIVNISYGSGNNNNVELQVFDLLGNMIQSKTYASNTGVNNIVLNVANFSKGIYYVSLNLNDKVISNKILIE